MGAKYNHLSPYERGQIAALHRNGVSNREIAQQIGRDHRTVDREFARNGSGLLLTGRVREAAEGRPRFIIMCPRKWYHATLGEPTGSARIIPSLTLRATTTSLTKKPGEEVVPLSVLAGLEFRVPLGGGE